MYLRTNAVLYDSAKEPCYIFPLKSPIVYFRKRKLVFVIRQRVP